MCVYPHEFAVFSGDIAQLEVHDAREDPEDLQRRLAAGFSLVLTGPYRFVDAVYRYCQHFEERLVPASMVAHLASRWERQAALTQHRRRLLHHLLVVGRGDSLVGVDDPPDATDLQDWLQAPTGDRLFLMPVRRFQRLLTDLRRAHEGLAIDALGATITILPHVYVPSDQSVPAMFTEYASLLKDRCVLDMGTGTGILALLAVQLGAARVVATDVNPQAVANARANVERLGLGHRVEIREAADLFDAVPGEAFDVILFNAPWIQGQPQTLYDVGLYDPGYYVLDGFLAGAQPHLKPDGAILLQYSNVSQRRSGEGMQHLFDTLALHGWVVASRRRLSRLSRVLGSRETVYLFELRQAAEG